eukprot:TRINITY_DN11453_c0_g1_i1.p1 TRINITY_DN11453_c0_g1~~TRINITY_DN11453_c0_g1_i1.p1  ORF type:complete len:707 (+),score=118.16 TRINITY_DN11453_c0_g1_i1:85-2205(+)
MTALYQDVVVPRQPGQALGCRFVENAKLAKVTDGSAGDAAGLKEYLNWTLTHINNEQLATAADIRRLCLAHAGDLRLRFKFPVVVKASARTQQPGDEDAGVGPTAMARPSFVSSPVLVSDGPPAMAPPRAPSPAPPAAPPAPAAAPAPAPASPAPAPHPQPASAPAPARPARPAGGPPEAEIPRSVPLQPGAARGEPEAPAPSMQPSTRPMPAVRRPPQPPSEPPPPLPQQHLRPQQQQHQQPQQHAQQPPQPQHHAPGAAAPPAGGASGPRPPSPHPAPEQPGPAAASHSQPIHRPPPQPPPQQPPAAARAGAGVSLPVSVQRQFPEIAEEFRRTGLLPQSTPDSVYSDLCRVADLGDVLPEAVTWCTPAVRAQLRAWEQRKEEPLTEPHAASRGRSAGWPPQRSASPQRPTQRPGTPTDRSQSPRAPPQPKPRKPPPPRQPPPPEQQPQPPHPPMPPGRSSPPPPDKPQQQPAPPPPADPRSSPPQAPAGPSAAEPFPVGTTVEVHGLVTQKQLNGLRGRFMRLDSKSGRALVDLGGKGGSKALRVSNLRPVPTAAASAAGGEAAGEPPSKAPRRASPERPAEPPAPARPPAPPDPDRLHDFLTKTMLSKLSDLPRAEDRQALVMGEVPRMMGECGVAKGCRLDYRRDVAAAGAITIELPVVCPSCGHTTVVGGPRNCLGAVINCNGCGEPVTIDNETAISPML